MNSSFKLIDGTLTGTTTPGPSELEYNSNEGVHHIPQTPRLEPHHQMQFTVISKTINGFKYYYQTLIILFNIIHLFTHRWFQVLLCSTNNSI